MRKVIVVSLAVLGLYSCGGPSDSSTQSKNEESAVLIDVAAIEKAYAFDVDRLSYAYGHKLQGSAARQVPFGFNVNKFLNAYTEGQRGMHLDKNALNQELGQLRQQRSGTPDQMQRVCEIVGQLSGINEGRQTFNKKMNLGKVSEGLEDALSGLNKLNINCDSIYDSEKNKFNEFVGKRYLEENSKREGVVQTASGLQYEVLKASQGEHPVAESNVTVHYRGTLIDGTEFDSSYRRGTKSSFGLKQVIAGWTEGLQLMSKGSKFRFFIPYEIAYGGRNTPTIPAYSTLVFDVELFDFK